MRALLIVLLLIAPARADPPIPVCDEVALLLGLAQPECSLCSGYPNRPRRKLSIEQARRDLLDAKVASRVARCGARNGAHGTVSVRITVDRDGNVDTVATQTSTGYEAIDRCILAVVRSADFRAAGASSTFRVKLRY